MSKITSKKAKTYESYQIISENTFEIARKRHTTSTLDAGAYHAFRDYWQNLFIESANIITDELIDIPNSACKEVLDEISSFLKDETKAKYTRNKFLYKKGVILYGKPGTGKTACVARVIEDAIKKNYIVFLDPDPSDLLEIMNAMRDIEPDRFVVCVWEDIDDLISYREGALLNLLDGRTNIENILYLATTNHIDKLPDRIKKRPSRFSKVIELKAPTKDERRIFLKSKLPENELWQLEALVEATENESFDVLKEACQNLLIFDMDPEEAASKARNTR